VSQAGRKPEPDGSAEQPEQPERLSDRRRLIQRAIKDGGPPPPGLEDVALKIAIRQAALRWIVALYVLGFVVEVLLIAVETRMGTRIRDGVIALLFLALGYQQWRVGQRAKAAVARWDVPADG
jgi:hypothetical protein